MTEPYEPGTRVPTQPVMSSSQGAFDPPSATDDWTTPGPTSGPVAGTAPKRRRSRLDLVLAMAGLLAFGGVAFAGGRYTGQAAVDAAAAAAAQNCGPGNNGPTASGAPDAGGGGPNN